MTSFTATGILTTQQYVTTGEVGYVTRNGAVLTTAVQAIVVESSAFLTVFGSVASASQDAIYGLNLSGARLNIADGGMVIGDTGAAINANVVATSAISNAGHLSGASGMLLYLAADLDVVNAGIIQGVSFFANGIYASIAAAAKLRLDNSGTIEASGSGALGLWLQGTGQALISNSGLISSSASNPAAINASSAMNLTNSGTILGDVIGSGLTSIRSSGDIQGNIILSAASDVVRVSGLVDGYVQLGNGSNNFYLSGGHIAQYVQGGSGNDVYHIDQSDIEIFDSLGGVDEVLSSADYRLYAGIERLTLTGAHGLRGVGNILGETITGDVGADTLRGLDGNDDLAGGQGDNRLYGGRGGDALQGGDGDEVMVGGLGDDTISGSEGADTIQGGFGTDLLLLDNAGFAAGATVNLATGLATINGLGTIKLSGIEDVQGTPGDDRLTGNAGANVLGGAGGNDTLIGGGGDDHLAGAKGAGLVTGGAGADRFVFAATSASNATYGIDHITDFEKPIDKIDLSGIDAVVGGSDDAFVFIGAAAFAGAGPQVRFVRDVGAGTTTIEARLGNSVTIDLTIVLDTALVLTVAQFDL